MMLQSLLWVLGLIMAIAARINPRVRAQFSKRRIIEIRVRNGPARHFVFAERRLRTVAGRAPQADATLIFSTTGLAVRSLLSPKLPARLMSGLQSGDVRIEGSTLLLLWFMGLAQQVVPVRRAPRLPATPPQSYIAHTASASVSQRITRLGEAHSLDAEMHAERAARDELRMLRGSAHDTLPF